MKKRMILFGFLSLILPSSLQAEAKSVEELFREASSAELQYASLRKPAEEELVRRGGEAVPYLVGKLGTRNARERHTLERVLRRIKGPAVEPLIEALKTDDPYTLRLGIRILGLIGDKRALPSLLEFSSYPDWRVRSVVAFALGRIGAREATPWLISALGDSVDLVRKSAAVSLGELNDPRATTPLLKGLSDPFYAVRYSSARALSKLGEAVIDSLLAILEEPLGRRGYYAIEVLGELGDKRALNPLISLLQNEDWAIRGFVAQAIGEIGGGEAKEALSLAKRREKHPFVLRKIGEGLQRLEQGKASQGDE